MGSVQRFQRWGLVNVSALVGPRFNKINIFYSSPEYYTKVKYTETRSSAVHQDAATGALRSRVSETLGLQWAVKKDDFFPYSDCAHCFWTGTP